MLLVGVGAVVCVALLALNGIWRNSCWVALLLVVVLRLRCTLFRGRLKPF